MTSAQEAPPQTVSAALFESVKIIFMSLKKTNKQSFMLWCFIDGHLKRINTVI